MPKSMVPDGPVSLTRCAGRRDFNLRLALTLAVRLATRITSYPLGARVKGARIAHSIEMSAFRFSIA